MATALPNTGCGVMKDERGYSIVEVLAVITLIGLLMGIASVSYQTMQKRYTEEQQIRMLFTDLMDARIRAMQHGRSTFVSLSNNTRYSIYEDTSPGPDGDGLLSTATDSLMITKNMIPAHTWVKSIPSVTVMQFTDKGLLSANTPTLWVRIDPSAGAEYDCIVINEIKTGMGSMNGSNCTVK